MVQRIILYKFQSPSDTGEEVGQRCDQIRRLVAQLEPTLELCLATPADASSERAWDLCLRLTHPTRPWQGEVAEALDRRIDQELGTAVAVRKSWSFRELSSP